jgi:hypothetical protein
MFSHDFTARVCIPLRGGALEIAASGLSEPEAIGPKAYAPVGAR